MVGAHPATTQRQLANLVGRVTNWTGEERDMSQPDLDGGTAWINAKAPISIEDLRGKIVLLDFWTFC